MRFQREVPGVDELDPGRASGQDTHLVEMPVAERVWLTREQRKVELEEEIYRVAGSTFRSIWQPTPQ